MLDRMKRLQNLEFGGKELDSLKREIAQNLFRSNPSNDSEVNLNLLEINNEFGVLSKKYKRQINYK